jgi:hypothetical protein
MRRLLLFVMSVVMLVGGLYLLAGELLWPDKIFHWVVLAGTILVTLGAQLL